MRERAQITRAQDDVQVAKQAVIGNTILNGNRLPPASYFQTNLSPVKNNQHPLFYADDTALEGTDICSFISTTLKVKTPTNPTGIADVAFVIASESQNHNMQTAKINNTVQTYNYAKQIDNNTSPVNIVENYDDIVDWVTLSQLQQEAKCSNNPLRIVNSSLPNTDTINSSSYNVGIVIDGNYSTPTADNCTFTNNNNFSYSNFTITNSGTTTGGTSTTVDCSVSADGKTVVKKFTINVDQSTGTGNNGTGNNGTGNNRNGFTIPIP
jgi:hypothetical protein